MSARTQPHLKSWFLKSLSRNWPPVALSTIVNTLFLQQNPSRGGLGLCLWPGSAGTTPIDRCYKCDWSDFTPTRTEGLLVQTVILRQSADVVKRTQRGWLQESQARPMVTGRHKEIAARVKITIHRLNQLDTKWQIRKGKIMGKYQLDDKGKAQVQRFQWETFRQVESIKETG